MQVQAGKGETIFGRVRHNPRIGEAAIAWVRQRHKEGRRVVGFDLLCKYRKGRREAVYRLPLEGQPTNITADRVGVFLDCGGRERIERDAAAVPGRPGTGPGVCGADRAGPGPA